MVLISDNEKSKTFYSSSFHKDPGLQCWLQRMTQQRLPCSEAKIAQQIALLKGQDLSADCPAQRPRSLSRLPCSEAKIAQQKRTHSPALPINLQNWLI